MAKTITISNINGAKKLIHVNGTLTQTEHCSKDKIILGKDVSNSVITQVNLQFGGVSIIMQSDADAASYGRTNLSTAYSQLQTLIT